MNVGNALAIMSRRRRAHVVSVKHKLFDWNEIVCIHAVEGWVSPKGLDANETAMRTAVTMHHQLVRHHVHICGGYVRTLIVRGLSLRMGIHRGTPVRDMVLWRMDYYGPMVNRASCVAIPSSDYPLFEL
jgi:hypothetical protein